MKLKCDYCGNTYEDTLEKCPSCGAPNPSHQNADKPKTIEDLKKWYSDRNLPAPEVTRFFIGVDYKEPKAFGIYKDDNGNYIVYKNKADGSRAVRYQGKDEEYAVNELYQRLKDEIVHQKNNSSKSTTKSSSDDSSGPKKISYILPKILSGLVVLLAIISGVVTIYGFILQRHNGYYHYNGAYYYTIDSDWFRYDNDWYPVPASDPAPQTISQNYDEYYVSKEWNSSIGTTDWNKSEYYSQYNSDKDSDYDWGDNDSWDSDSTDWDSDW